MRFKSGLQTGSLLRTSYTVPLHIKHLVPIIYETFYLLNKLTLYPSVDALCYAVFHTLCTGCLNIVFMLFIEWE